MKKLFSILVILILLLVIYLFTQNTNLTTSSEQSEQVVILNNDINLRKGPGLTYPIAVSVNEGQAFSMIEQKGDWIYVAKDEETVGWVPAWHTSSNEQNQSSSNIKVAISTVNGLNVRAEPKTSSAVLTQLSLGNETVVVKEEKNWVKIEDSLGTSGWVSKEYINIKEKSAEVLSEMESPSEVESFITIKVESVNVRDEPDASSAIVGTVNKEETFKILDQKNNWYKIEISEDQVAWVYRFYGVVDSIAPSSNESKSITIIYGGTNLRESPSTNSPVVKRASLGESYEILSTEGDWYEIAISSNESAYVAQWVVSSDIKQQSISKDKPVVNRKKGTLNGVTIVLDPGHGGNDQGTAGYRGSIEKDITLMTAQLLQEKLKNAGATVYLTRESDMYVDLRKRVSVAHTYAADAFISIHYDATDDSTISGFTTYYYHDYQQKLAQFVNDSLAKKVTLRDRGAQIGDYLVLRENYQNAILIELGYLSNPTEERVITTDFYREQATLGIYEGIINYFDAQLQ